MADDSSSWSDSSEDEAPKENETVSSELNEKKGKGELKMRNEDADSWDDESEEEPAVTAVETAAKSEAVSERPRKAPVQKEWSDESDDDDGAVGAPKAKSQKKSKAFQRKLREKEANAKKAAKQKAEYSDDSSEEEVVGTNAALKDRAVHNQKSNALLFGNEKGQKKKKAQKRVKTKPMDILRDLFPVNRESRLEAGKDLRKLSAAINEYILDLSMGGLDQNGKPVKPVISPNQAKTFVCQIISRSLESLDYTQLADVRRQIESEMKKFQNRQIKNNQMKRRGMQVREKEKRKIFIEKDDDPVYVDGSYNDTDFEAFL